MERFISTKRTAIDGKTWWCVWDTEENKWSTFLCFGKYKLKRDCDYAIRMAFEKGYVL